MTTNRSAENIAGHKLIIDEPPLQVLPSLALAIGLNKAIFVQQLHYLLRISKNVVDGETWVYNSAQQWNEHFPFWDVRTIQRIIADLEKQEILISGSYNRLKIDRTKWYRINYDSLRQFVVMDNAKCHNGSDKVSQPIPKTTTKITTKIKTTTHKSAPGSLDPNSGRDFVEKLLGGTVLHGADPGRIVNAAIKYARSREWIEIAIDVLDQQYRQDASKIKDPTALLVGALKNGIDPPEGYVTKAKREAKTEQTRASEEKHDEQERRLWEEATQKFKTLPKSQQDKYRSQYSWLSQGVAQEAAAIGAFIRDDES